MSLRWLAALGVLVGGCHKDADPPAPPPPPPKAVAPIRGAAGDADLRVMLSELASAKACTMIKGQFRPLRAPDRREVVTGILWIRECSIQQSGTKVTFHLAGNGWQWADQTKRKAGGTFVLRQYVKFGVTVELPGTLDIAYDDGSHVVSLWFSPQAAPDIRFEPVGDLDVDKKGLWSSVIGGVSSLFASSPEHQAEGEAKKQGTHQFENELADGMAVTINLCTGLSRFNLGRPAKGAMQAPDAGETHKVPIELQPGGLMVFGPQLAPDGMTIQVAARQGAVRMAMACADQAEKVAESFIAGPAGEAPYLTTADVRTTARLHVPAQRCPVVVLAKSLETSALTVFDWQRPLGETARSTGGPLIHCGGAARPAAKR
ncbi:MAG TPA: hypothetical protein VLM79_27300 [Kofleriaceae bacterium]|nr:hypothetical protein [Kofleriaceae bacterium]